MSTAPAGRVGASYRARWWWGACGGSQLFLSEARGQAVLAQGQGCHGGLFPSRHGAWRPQGSSCVGGGAGRQVHSSRPGGEMRDHTGLSSVAAGVRGAGGKRPRSRAALTLPFAATPICCAFPACWAPSLRKLRCCLSVRTGSGGQWGSPLAAV